MTFIFQLGIAQIYEVNKFMTRLSLEIFHHISNLGKMNDFDYFFCA